MEFETKGFIESKEGYDWPVEIIWEYDGGIQINGVYNDSEQDSETDFLADLSKDQLSQVEQICIDEYASKCDAAQAAAEDYGDWKYEQRRDA